MNAQLNVTLNEILPWRGYKFKKLSGINNKKFKYYKTIENDEEKFFKSYYLA